MVPAAVVVLDALPVTAQRQAGPGRVAGAGLRRRCRRERAARTERERVLCELVAQVLELPEVGVDDGFFDLGGDSIVSIQLVSRARRAAAWC